MVKKSEKALPHTLENEEQLAAITKRLKRAHGQMGAIIRMLEEGRSCEDVVTQMSAVGKAINTAAITLISASLKECIESEEADTEVITARLQKLFLSFA
ncbi:MAG: metal-sensitive transcriptional regulator [Candidatus Nanopelagicaceae bacterium]|nr:metal-sensitive transcriptional regulator [Candidatus Nanopelagicaceae bacterium]